MNTQNIEKLADHLTNLPPTRFDMRIFGSHHSCGTIACIAGHAVLLLDPTITFDTKRDIYRNPKGDRVDPQDHAQDLLGLDRFESSELFIPMNRNAHCGAKPGEPDYIDLPRAIVQLRHLVETGSVDWEATPNG